MASRTTRFRRLLESATVLSSLTLGSWASAQTTEYQGWDWEYNVAGGSSPLLSEEECNAQLNLSLVDADSTWTVSGMQEICWGRETDNASPARVYVNWDGSIFPVVESWEGQSTQPLVSAGGNLFEIYGEEIEEGVGTGEDRLGTLLSEPSGADLIIVGGSGLYSNGGFLESSAFIAPMVKFSANVAAARLPSDIEGLWRLSFFQRLFARDEIDSKLSVTSIHTVNLMPEGVCSFVESTVFQEPEFDDSDNYLALQDDADGIDLTNRTANGLVLPAVFSDCTWIIDGNGYLVLTGIVTSIGGPEAFDSHYVISDDDKFLVLAPDPDSTVDHPSGVMVGYRVASGMEQDALDGNYLFHLNGTEFEATGTAHSGGLTGTQEYDIVGRGLLSFDSQSNGTIPPGQVGFWSACTAEVVIQETAYQVDGSPGGGTVTSALDVFSDLENLADCSYQVGADGSVLIALDTSSPGEDAEYIVFAGYINDTGELFSLGLLQTDPSPYSLFFDEDHASVYHIVAMRYTGDPAGNEDDDAYSNLEEFEAPLPTSQRLPLLVSTPVLNTSGAVDLAVIRQGSTLAEIRDGGTGALLKTLSFFGNGFTPITAAALPDADGDGAAELAVLATRDLDGRIVAEVRNISGPENARFVWFAADHTPIAMAAIVDDADGNGVPELAVLSTRDSDGRGVVEVKNSFGATGPNSVWSASGFTPMDLVILPDSDSNGVPELAVLSTRDSDGRIVVNIKNASGATNPSAVWFMPGNTPIDLTAVGDKDSNGVPEVAVLSSRSSDGRNVVEVKNARGATGPTAVWFFPGATASQVAAIDDSDGNGVPEVAVLSTRDSDGRIVVEVKNAAGATSPSTLWYLPGFSARGMAVLDDADANGVEEAGVLMIRDSDGRILVQGRNADGSGSPNNYWFSP